MSASRALVATQAAELGADAALVATPAYVKPSQQGLVKFYQKVADEGTLPLLLYNVSARVAPTTGAASVLFDDRWCLWC